MKSPLAPTLHCKGWVSLGGGWGGGGGGGIHHFPYCCYGWGLLALVGVASVGRFQRAPAICIVCENGEKNHTIFYLKMFLLHE